MRFLSHTLQYIIQEKSFLFWMVYCGIWDRCIVWLVRMVYYIPYYIKNHYCSEWCIVGYETGALYDLWEWSIISHTTLKIISVLNGMLWDMRQVHCFICEIGLLYPIPHNTPLKDHLCYELCIVGYERGALYDLWDWSIISHYPQCTIKRSSLLWAVCCGIWDRCIAWFVRLVYYIPYPTIHH